MTGRTAAPLRALSRYRRALGAVCAALALTGAVLLLRPPAAPSVEVLVAARSLDALSPLSPGDLAVRALPLDAVPQQALGPGDDPAGRSLTGPVARGEVITRARIAEPPARGYGPGLVAAPVRLPQALPPRLLHPGSRIDVLAAPDADMAGLGGGAPPARTVVEDRPVITVSEPDAAAGTQGALVVLAVRPDEARALAGHAAASRLSVALR
ncbi:Flp pilus assembly protein CpaB [Streptomonospora sp. PA3]|uniref:SAF domain-containing protein n=1 Tax=Streptomonospora sp. PA3 TaxID=2607326 RepID=UPI0012DCCF47|nr:SAF domain-containing protein [Streptomonospora sp. PA3]MUL42333.1 Flp pilus assembly protein CpaB [Streptomonospora sp. PA3]